MAVDKDLKVDICTNNRNLLLYLLATLAEVFTSLIQILTKLLQIVFYEVDTTIIIFLYSVQYWLIRCGEHVYSKIQFVKLSLIFILGDVYFILLLRQLFVLDTDVSTIIYGALSMFVWRCAVIASECVLCCFVIDLLILLQCVHLIKVIFLSKEHISAILM